MWKGSFSMTKKLLVNPMKSRWCAANWEDPFVDQTSLWLIGAISRKAMLFWSCPMV